MDEGKKRPIPSRMVYDAIFRDWEGIIKDLHIDLIETGKGIPEWTYLFRCEDSNSVFLVDYQDEKRVKRGVVAREVMDRYNFDWGKVHLFNVPLADIGIPNGTPIKNP